MDMLEKIPAITLYQKALNAYNPDVYPAHKKISAEEWNALMLSLFAQGNRQEHYLEQIVNGHLTEFIETINDIIDSINNSEEDMLGAITLAINAHNTGDTDPHKNVLNPIKNRLTATEETSNSTKTLAESNEGRIDDLETLGETHNDEIVALQTVDAGLRTDIDATTIIANNAKDFALDSYKSVTYNGTTGELTFTRNDATETKVDLPLENIIASGYYDAATKELALVMVSGDEIRVPAEDLVDDYFGSTSANIDINISSENIISAVLKSGTITEAQLATALATKLNAKANTADLSAVAFSGLYGDIIGTPSIPTRTSELTNNSDFTTNAKVNTEVSRIDGELADKQPTLVNQVNLKSINNNSLLGSGNIDLAGTIAPLVNNLTDGGTTSALTAEMGKELDINKANLDYVNTQDSTQLALAKAYSDSLILYDKVIRTQAEFEALIASPTWFGATSVAFVGQFTLSTLNNSGVKRPANVTRIDGYNNAKITVTNFKFNSTTARGGLWDDADANNPRCYINDLTVDCTGTGYGYGFSGNGNTYINCTGTVTGTSGYGFSGSNNAYINCTGTGTGTGTSTGTGGNGAGFTGSSNTYTNCTGTGTSGTGSNGYGFSGDNNTYTNCTGTSTGTVTGTSGYGFDGSNNAYINCTGTGTGSNGRGFTGSSNTYTNCTGTGTGTGNYGTGYGFNGSNNTYINCTGTGTGSNGRGFSGNNNAYTNCTGTGTGSNGFGFSGNNNAYTNCTGTGTGSNGFGFGGDNNTYTNCTGTGTSTGSNGFGAGFFGFSNTYTNCTGTGTGTGTGGNGAGFSGSNNAYINCTGTGTGTGGYGTGTGYGFNGSNNRIISCTALAYVPTGITLSNTNCVPIYNPTTSANLFMIIRDCKFPQIEKTGYQQGTIWCNIANNTTMVGSIKDNVYHSSFTDAPIKGENVVADNNSAVDITAI